MRLRQARTGAGTVALCLLGSTHVSLAADTVPEIAFNDHCRECHSALKDDNRLGPSLYGIVGRKAGTQPGYDNYTDVLKQSGIVWTEDLLDRWIENPAALVPNNNMQPYPGVADPAERRKIIDFLKSDTGAGAP